MAVFKTLQALKEKTETTPGVSRENFLSLDSGESVRLFFRQEITEDAKNYDSERGAANWVAFHVSEEDFRKKMVCTNDEAHDFKCWACEAGKRPRTRALINVLVMKNGDWAPKILEAAYSRRGGQPANAIIDFADEYGTLTDREYKFSRTGVKLDTKYSLIPLNQADLPDDDSNFEMIDTSSVFREIPYEDQAEYMMTPLEDKKSEEKSEDGSGW